MTTTGFKRHRAEFQDLLYQNLRRVGSASSDAGTIVPTGVQLGLGVKSAAIYRISGPGNIMQTENPLDLAINGRGFLRSEEHTSELQSLMRISYAVLCLKTKNNAPQST